MKKGRASPTVNVKACHGWVEFGGIQGGKRLKLKPNARKLSCDAAAGE
jgi:hypothetical protein